MARARLPGGQLGRGVESLPHAAVAHDVAERGGEPERRLGFGGDRRLDPAAPPAARHLLRGERGHRAPAAPAVRLLDVQLPDRHRVAEPGGVVAVYPRRRDGCSHTPGSGVSASRRGSC